MRLSMKWAQVGARVLGGLIAGFFAVAGPACAAEEPARVLILNALDPYLPAFLAIDSAMRASLVSENGRRIVLFSEPLDAQRFAVEPLEPELLALLTKKYRALPIDVVVTVTKPAFDFYLRHGERLWPGARLVFHGLPDPGNGLPDRPAQRHRAREPRRLWRHARSCTTPATACAPDSRGVRRLAFGPGTGAAGTTDRAEPGRRRRGGVPHGVAARRTRRAGRDRTCGHDRALSHPVSRPRRSTVPASRGAACHERRVGRADLWPFRDLCRLRCCRRQHGVLRGSRAHGRAAGA